MLGTVSHRTAGRICIHIYVSNQYGCQEPSIGGIYTHQNYNLWLLLSWKKKIINVKFYKFESTRKHMYFFNLPVVSWNGIYFCTDDDIVLWSNLVIVLELFDNICNWTIAAMETIWPTRRPKTLQNRGGKRTTWKHLVSQNSWQNLYLI